MTPRHPAIDTDRWQHEMHAREALRALTEKLIQLADDFKHGREPGVTSCEIETAGLRLARPLLVLETLCDVSRRLRSETAA
jgi:hypothetical protein